MSAKDYSNNPEVQKIADKYNNLEKERKKKEDLRNIKVKVEGKDLVIKRWNHFKALDNSSLFLDLWVADIYADSSKNALSLSMGGIDELDMSDAIRMLSHGLRNLNFEDYLADFLDEVYIKGEQEPLTTEQLNELFDSPLSIFELFKKVAEVNFMMPLCLNILQTPFKMMEESTPKETSK